MKKYALVMPTAFCEIFVHLNLHVGFAKKIPYLLAKLIHPKLILHVDDDPDDRFLVCDAINGIDPSFRVMEAENGLKAIEILKKARMIGELPALVILDFNMPMMNGMQTYKEIRKHPEFCNIPVVLLTTFTNKRDDSWEDESVATFTKPSTFSELTSKIREILTILRFPQ